MKFDPSIVSYAAELSPPARGAWIEIKRRIQQPSLHQVAPPYGGGVDRNKMDGCCLEDGTGRPPHGGADKGTTAQKTGDVGKIPSISASWPTPQILKRSAAFFHAQIPNRRPCLSSVPLQLRQRSKTKGICNVPGRDDQGTFCPIFERGLLPTLKPGDMVVMDDMRSHHVTAVREVLEERG